MADYYTQQATDTNQYQNQDQGNYSNTQYQSFDQMGPVAPSNTYAQQPNPYGQQNYQQNYQIQQDNNLEFSKIGDLEFSARQGFVRKVYSLLALELGATLLLCALSMNTSLGNILVQGYVEQECVNGRCTIQETQIKMKWFFIVCCIVSPILQIVLFCFTHLAKKTPLNYILLCLYIVFYGFLISGICLMAAIYYGQAMIWIAWGITAGMVIGLTTYACTTKTDMTIKFGFAWVMILPILTCSILCFIFPYSDFLFIWLCCMCIILYGFYLIWETQIILGCQRLQLSIDHYVLASLALYGTIMQLFLRILEILAISRR